MKSIKDGTILKNLEERKKGIQNGELCGCGLESCWICRAFGPHKNTSHLLGPTRLIFRDAKIVSTKESIKNIQIPKDSYTLEEIKKYSQEKGLAFAEIKSENIINRHTGRASDPRPIERVIEGTLFEVEIVARIFNNEEESRAILGLLSKD